MKKHIMFYTLYVIFVICFAITILGLLNVIRLDSKILAGLCTAYAFPLAAQIYHLFKKTDVISDDEKALKVKSTVIASKDKDTSLSVLRSKSEISISHNSDLKNESIVKIVIGDIAGAKFKGKRCVAVPVNSSFQDDCLLRRNSSTGAFVLSCAGQNIHEHLPKINIEFEKVSKSIGGIVLMRDFINTPFDAIFLAVTTKDKEGFITTTPINIAFASQELVRFIRPIDIYELYCPIFGSGDGGVPSTTALVSMIRGFFMAFQNYKCNKITITIVAHKSTFDNLEEIESCLIKAL